MLDALCLQHLLSQLAGDNLSLYFRDYTDQALDGKSTKKVKKTPKPIRIVTYMRFSSLTTGCMLFPALGTIACFYRVCLLDTVYWLSVFPCLALVDCRRLWSARRW